MKTVKSKAYNDVADPPRWEYKVTDGITSVGMWSAEELIKADEKGVYKKLECLLEEENLLSDRH